MQDKKNMEMRRKTKIKWGVNMQDKIKKQMRHKTKQIWETRRETKKMARGDARQKKWRDGTQDKTSSIRTKMRPIYVRMKEFS